MELAARLLKSDQTSSGDLPERPLCQHSPMSHRVNPSDPTANLGLGTGDDPGRQSQLLRSRTMAQLPRLITQASGRSSVPPIASESLALPVRIKLPLQDSSGQSVDSMRGVRNTARWLIKRQAVTVASCDNSLLR